jgi:hypothetical protein
MNITLDGLRHSVGFCCQFLASSKAEEFHGIRRPTRSVAGTWGRVLPASQCVRERSVLLQCTGLTYWRTEYRVTTVTDTVKGPVLYL